MALFFLRPVVIKEVFLIYFGIWMGNNHIMCWRHHEVNASCASWSPSFWMQGKISGGEYPTGFNGGAGNQQKNKAQGC
jgi:hypothetical protein